MHAYSMPVRLIGGLTLLALCGCQTYSPYGPYGTGYGYPPPGTYSTPPSYSTPGGTVLPGTVMPNRNGGTVLPGKAAPNGGVRAPMSGSAANTGGTPTIEAKRGTGGLLPNEKPVPEPKSAEPSSFSTEPAGPAKSGAAEGAFSPSPASGIDKPGESTGGFPAGSSPFDNSTAVEPPATDSSRIKLTGSNKGDGLDEPPRFQQPKTAVPIAPAPGAPAKGGSSTVIEPSGSTPMSSNTGTPSPYAYDAKAYTWLRGKVDYDEGTKTWQIIYSLDGKDKFGGSLTLGNDPKLTRMRNDDVFLVEGRVDGTRKTDRGKPVYRVENVFGPLVPKTKVGALAPSPATAARNDVVTTAR